jgi:hypothetical protein
MVNTYEILNCLKKANCLQFLVQKGIIPISFLDHQVIYNVYLKYREHESKMQAYESIASECQVSSSTVRIAVKRLES